MRLIEEATEPASLAPHTQGFRKSETLIARAGESDTLPGHTPVDWALPKSLPPAKRRAIWQTLSKVLLVAAGRRRSAGSSIRRRGGAARSKKPASPGNIRCELAANFATSEILKEINLRFDILEKLAKDADLAAADAQRRRRRRRTKRLWKPVEDKLGSTKADNDKQAPADSWFISTRERHPGRPQPAQRRQPRRQLFAPRLLPRPGRRSAAQHTRSEADHRAASVGRLSQHVDRPAARGVFGADQRASAPARAR